MFSKIADFDNVFDKNCVLVNLSHFGDDKAINTIEKCVDKTECYDLAHDEIIPI